MSARISPQALRMAPLLALFALLSSAGPSIALQARGPGDGDRIGLQVAQRSALQIERERALLEAWMHAADSERPALERLVRAGSDPRRSSLRPLDLGGISNALRASHDPAQDPELGPWYELIDSLGLRVVPGVFAARSEGRGEPITVHLESLWKSDFGGQQQRILQACLVWVSATGDEVVARREPVTPQSLKSGFEMYIRPPLSGPQTWQLLLELRVPEGLLRSFPVAVECLADLEQTRSRLARPAPSDAAAPGTWNEPLRLQILTRLRMLTRHGIRVAQGTPLAHWIANYDRSGLAQPQDALGHAARLGTIDGAQLGVPGETFWELLPARCSERVLLLLTDLGEAPTDLLTGVQGRAWRSLAEACGVRVIAGHLPVDATHLQPLENLARSLQQGSDRARLIVVARGDSGRTLPRLLAADSVPGLAGFILSESIAAGAPFSSQLKVPALRVQFDAAPASLGIHELGQGSSRRTHVALPQPGSLAIPSAIDAIRVWIESL